MFTPEFWKKFLRENYGRLEVVVRKRFAGNKEMTKDAVSHVCVRLLENNARLLAMYDPDKGAKRETYFWLKVNFLVTDFIYKEKGRCVLPKWLKKQGNSLLEEVYRLICCKGWSEDHAIEYLRHSAPGGRSTSVIEEAILQIRNRSPDCGQSRKTQVPLEDFDLVSQDKSPEEEAVCKEIREAVLDDPGDGPEHDMGKLAERLRTELELTPEKRLFLRMIYQDGMSVPAAGRQLGWNKNQAFGHQRRLIEQLRGFFSQSHERDNLTTERLGKRSSPGKDET